jgi:hypothetical protein
MDIPQNGSVLPASDELQWTPLSVDTVTGTDSFWDASGATLSGTEIPGIWERC